MRQTSAFYKVSVVTFTLMLHSAEVGTHFVCQTGKTVQKFGIVPEHLVILRFLIYNIVINFAPAFLKQRSALDFNILSPILDDIMQGAVDAVGNNLDLVAVINLAVTGALVGSGTRLLVMPSYIPFLFHICFFLSDQY